MDRYNQLEKKYSSVSHPLKLTIDEMLTKCSLEIEDGKENNIFNDFKAYIDNIKSMQFNSDDEIISALNNLSQKGSLYGINSDLFKKPAHSKASNKMLLKSNIEIADKINTKNIEKYYKDYENYKVNEYECIIDNLIDNANKLQNSIKSSSLTKSLQNSIIENMMSVLSHNVLNALNSSNISHDALKHANNLHMKYLSSNNSKSVFNKLLKLMKEHNIDTSFWENQLKNNAKNIQDLFYHALAVYKEEISKKSSKNIFDSMQQQYMELLNKLNQYIDNLDSIFNQLKKMGQVGKLFQQSFESMAEQLWYDNSSGSINISQLELIEEYANLIENNKEIQKICDIIGRLEQELLNISREKIQNVEHYINIIPVKHFKEEVSGITLGRDISSLVPSEYSIMFDEDMDILFNLKYVENRLMMFENLSYLSQMNSKDTEEEIEKNDNKEDEKGPVILCIDTSSSMRGMPEYLAKAMLLYIITRANKENRDCFLINFSTNIETLDFKKGKNFNALMSFLQMSFYGGTDAMPAFEKAIKMLKEEEYKKADVLMISDFIYPYISDNLSSKMEEEKKNGTKFYALSIGYGEEAYKTHDYFDSFWYYNVYNHTISKIGGMIDNIQNTLV